MPDPWGAIADALSARYRIDREIGAGGMATVYLAHDLKHDRDVAIKVLNPNLAAAVGAERFVSEIRTVAHLKHPHILPLFDSGSADGFLFYVMPFIEGESLQIGSDESPHCRLPAKRRCSSSEPISKAIPLRWDYEEEAVRAKNAKSTTGRVWMFQVGNRADIRRKTWHPPPVGFKT